MIITRAPLRVSFAGGGSDVPAWYENHDYGEVFGATISLYVNVIVARHHKAGRYRVAYSLVEDTDSLEHMNHQIIRGALSRCGEVRGGLEIHTIADIPGRGSGLGSSAAVAVATIKALAAYRTRVMHWIEVAEMAAAIEIDDMKAGSGKQDQYLIAHGGVVGFKFRNKKPLAEVYAPYVDQNITERWSKWMPLLPTGMAREAAPVMQETSARLQSGAADEAMLETLEMLPSLRAALLLGDMDAAGDGLDKAWALKRKAAPHATNPHIDALYERAKAAGAIGGKLCGAGGGGYLLLVVPPRCRQAVADELNADLITVRYGESGAVTIYSERER